MQTVLSIINFSFFIYLGWNPAVENQVSGACKMSSGLLCAQSCHSRGLWPLQYHPSPGRCHRSSAASQATTEIIPRRGSFKASSL